jgi:hypothetical protein
MGCGSICVSALVRRRCLGVGAAGSLRRRSGSWSPTMIKGSTAGRIWRSGSMPWRAGQAMLATGLVWPGLTRARGSFFGSALNISMSWS